LHKKLFYDILYLDWIILNFNQKIMSNPLMSEDMFTKTLEENSEVMTLEWAINKSLTLIWLTIITAIWVWKYAEMILPFYIPIVIIAFVIALIIIFFKKTSPFLAPVYAILEWVAIWVISSLFEKEMPWIIIQTVSLTFWVFIIMLGLYKYKIIKATEKFKSSIISATWAIALIYIISLVWSATGWFSIPYIHESGLIWIGFSVVVTGIAAMNLILDFDNIEMWVKMKAPKYMEWYSSFSLLVTLIWLYLEILRLLSKIRR